MKIIHIPRTPATAFDKHREVSDLVRNQVRHAYKELHDWWRTVGSIEPDQVQTEQQAAEYIRTITRILHPEGTHPSRSIPKSPAPKSGVWLGDPSESRERKRPRARKRPRTRSRKRTRSRSRSRSRSRKR